MKKLGSEVEDKIDWSSPRLCCIAGNFTKYDEHAVQQPPTTRVFLVRQAWESKPGQHLYGGPTPYR